MDEPTYRLVYDAATQAELVEPTVVVVLSVTLIVVVGAVLVFRRVRKRRSVRIDLVVVALVGMFVLMTCGALCNSHTEGMQCKRWAQSGDYEIVEGVLEDLYPYGPYRVEQFTVNGVVFQYSPAAPLGGFKGRTAHGRVIREGLRVRIGYRDNIILRLWIAKEGEQQRR